MSGDEVITSYSLYAQGRTITFNNRVSVILVPTSAEYLKAGCDLWWSNRDLVRFKFDFLTEIRHLLSQDSSITSIQDAMRTLCDLKS